MSLESPESEGRVHHINEEAPHGSSIRETSMALVGGCRDFGGGGGGGGGETGLWGGFPRFPPCMKPCAHNPCMTGNGDEEDMADIRAAVQRLISTFRTPLESKGVCMATIQDELEEAVEYARKCLAIGRESYRKMWYKLHTCPDSSKWSNLLQLSKLVFSLPFTTSRVEQIFSKFKVINTSRRTGLHNSTLCDLLEIP